MSTPTCPCCSETLLRHIRVKDVYWFCRHCYQEMPHYGSPQLHAGNPRQQRFDSTIASQPKGFL
ncbi:MAG TPA: hypothetical protein V6C95_02005 [Coleofasciculaceae cyanobacterium]